MVSELYLHKQLQTSILNTFQLFIWKLVFQGVHKMHLSLARASPCCLGKVKVLCFLQQQFSPPFLQQVFVPSISTPIPSALPNPWWRTQWQSRSNPWLIALRSGRASQGAGSKMLPAAKISTETRSLLCSMSSHYSRWQRHIAQMPHGSVGWGRWRGIPFLCKLLCSYFCISWFAAS